MMCKMCKYIFVLLVFLLRHNASAMDSFWEKIRSNSTNPQQLLSELKTLPKDHRAVLFCKCFEGEDPKSAFSDINEFEKNEIRKAAKYVSQSLYELVQNASLDEDLQILENAARFASIALSGDLSFFQNKELSDANSIYDAINTMIEHRRNFLSAIAELKMQ